jgi:hypothetical protein
MIANSHDSSVGRATPSMVGGDAVASRAGWDAPPRQRRAQRQRRGSASVPRIEGVSPGRTCARLAGTRFRHRC